MERVDLDVVHGERRAILGPNGAGKTTLFNVICGDLPASSGPSSCSARTSRSARAVPRQTRARSHVPTIAAVQRADRGGLASTCRSSASRADAFRPLCSLGGRKAIRERARRRRPTASPSHGGSARSSARSPTGSTGRSRSRCRSPRTPRPHARRAGFGVVARGARLLIELLLGLDRSITLVLIEHDMDIALRVAERVTMMHDGRVIVEGTPDEIRANETVHDLYLGRGYTMGELQRRARVAVRTAPRGRGPRRVLRERAGARGRHLHMGSESVAIVGRNGMGKTTLCNAIMGISPPSAQGSSGSGRRARRRRSPTRSRGAGSATCPRAPPLSVPHRRSAPPDRLARRSGGGSSAWTRERVYELFPRLAERKSNGGAELSGGEQQMLAIGRALVTNPTIVVMDEPSEGLAPAVIEGLIETFKHLEEEGLAILLIEQYLGVATAIAERVRDDRREHRRRDDGRAARRRPRPAAPVPRRRAARSLVCRGPCLVRSPFLAAGSAAGDGRFRGLAAAATRRAPTSLSSRAVTVSTPSTR